MQAIDIKLKLSWLFLSLLVVAVCGSMLIIFTLPVLMILKSLLVIVVLIYSLDIFWRYGLLKGRHALTRICFDANGWQIWSQDKKFTAELCGDSTVTTLVSVLRFKLPTSRYKYSSVIFFDSLAPDFYRQLIVLLRTSRAHRAERLRRGSL